MLLWFKNLVVGKMKEETGSFVIDEFVRLKPNMHFYIFFILVSIKKKSVWIKELLQQQTIVNTKVFFWMINGWGPRWTGYKVNVIKKEPILFMHW